jgi:thiol-disulfide isomerase/thioredoxin
MRILTALALSIILSCATADQVKALEQRVQQLELLVDEQARHPSVVIKYDETTSEEVKPAVGTGGNEDEAKVLSGEILAKYQNGEALEAKRLMAQLRSKHGGTDIYKSREVQSLEANLDVVGKKITSEDIRKNIDNWYIEGEINLEEGVTLLVFWEVWCPHCKREVPKLKQTYEKYRDDGLKVLSLTKLSKSATEQKVLTFIQESELNYPTAKENGKISPIFDVKGVPAAAVVNNGVVVWRGHPGKIGKAAWSQWL